MPLIGDLLGYFDQFDFSIFRSKSLLELIAQHETTTYHAVRFEGGLPPHPIGDPPPHELGATAQVSFDTDLTGTDGRRRRYAVIPVQAEGETRWLDPAGFELAVSQGGGPEGRDPFRNDFELLVAETQCNIIRTLRPN